MPLPQEGAIFALQRTGAGAARYAWIDFAKAIAIALVVFGHASRSIERTDGLVWSDTLRLADALIYSFHIPLFFVLAGFTAGLQRSRSLGTQVRGLLWGIGIPYVVWTIIWVGLKIAFPGAVNTPLTAADLMHALWQPVEHLWFLQHLLIARLLWLTLDLAGLAKPRWSGTAVIVLMFTACTLLATLSDASGHLGILLGNAGLFGLGLVWLPAVYAARDHHWVAPAAAAIAVLWLSAALGLRPADSSWTGILVAIAGSAMVIGLVWRLPPPASWVSDAFAFLGEVSLAIYLIHPILIGAVRVALTKAGVLTGPGLVLGGTLVGLVLPAAGFWLLLVLSARSGQPLLRWLGLGNATRSHYLPARAPAIAAIRSTTRSNA